MAEYRIRHAAYEEPVLTNAWERGRPDGVSRAEAEAKSRALSAQMSEVVTLLEDGVPVYEAMDGTGREVDVVECVQDIVGDLLGPGFKRGFRECVDYFRAEPEDRNVLRLPNGSRFRVRFSVDVEEIPIDEGELPADAALEPGDVVDWDVIGAGGGANPRKLGKIRCEVVYAGVELGLRPRDWEEAEFVLAADLSPEEIADLRARDVIDNVQVKDCERVTGP